MNEILPFDAFFKALAFPPEDKPWIVDLSSDNILDKAGTHGYIKHNQDMVSLVLDYTEAVYVWWWMQILLNLRISWSKLVTSKELVQEYRAVSVNAYRVLSRVKESIITLLWSSDRAPIDSLIYWRGDWIHQALMKWENSARIQQHYLNPVRYLTWRFFKEIWFKDDHFG